MMRQPWQRTHTTYHSKLLRLTAGAAIATGAAAGGVTTAQAADPWVQNIAASYRIQLAGVKFGKFHFSSNRKGSSYTVSSNAKLKAFFGAFKWRGSASSAGAMTPTGPVPTRYHYGFRKNKKTPKSVSLALADGNAIKVTHTPPRNLKKNRVPVTKKHYKGVLDPMSALIALSTPAEGKGKNPCKQTARVFDGMHRFDIKLTPKGAKRIKLSAGKGFSTKALICNVEPVPIAGHKTGKNYDYIADPKDAEVWLVPAGNGLIYVPYKVVVPTIIGHAVLQATSVTVDLSNKQRLAMAH